MDKCPACERKFERIKNFLNLKMGLEDKPNKDNVKVGDFLVSDLVNKIVLLPIKNNYEEGVFAEGVRVDYRLYENAVILKKDGTYLVGENVTNSHRKP